MLWAEPAATATPPVKLLTGTVWGWGYKGYRELGDGSNTNRGKNLRVGTIAQVISNIRCPAPYCAVTLQSDAKRCAGADGDYSRQLDYLDRSRFGCVGAVAELAIAIISPGPHGSIAL